MTVAIQSVFDQTYAAIRERIERQREANALKMPSELALSRELGVSRPTVRRVYQRLARERIIDRRHGRGTYIRPTQRVRSIVALVYARPALLYSDYTAAILRGAASVVEEAGGVEFRVHPIERYHDEELTADLLEDVSALRADGLLLTLPLRLEGLNRLLEAHVPVATVNVDYGREDIPAALPDNREAGRMAARYLKRRGVERIALVATRFGHDTIRTGRAVTEGLQEFYGVDALREGENLFVVERDPKAAHDAVKRLLAREPGPQGIVVTQAALRRGAVTALQEAGLDGRANPVLVAYDHEVVDSPGLVIVRVAMEACGREAARMLLTLMEGKSVEQPVRLFRPTMVQHQPLVH